jgi:hypothetical protein
MVQTQPWLLDHHDMLMKAVERHHHGLMGKVANVEHAHKVFGTHLMHLRPQLPRDRVRTPGDDKTRGVEVVPAQRMKIHAFAIAFPEVSERLLGMQRCPDVALCLGDVASGLVETPIPQRKKITQRGLGNGARFGIRFIYVDSAGIESAPRIVYALGSDAFMWIHSSG